MNKQHANQSEQKKIEHAIEKAEQKKIQSVIEKNEPRNLGKVSFTSACRSMLKNISSTSPGDHLKFEEKKSGDIFEIKVEIKKIPDEVFTDEKGKTWKRIA